MVKLSAKAARIIAEVDAELEAEGFVTPPPPSPTHPTFQQWLLVRNINTDNLVEWLRDDKITRPDRIKKERKNLLQKVNRWLSGETVPRGETRYKLLFALHMTPHILDELVSSGLNAMKESPEKLAVRLARAALEYVLSVRDSLERSNLEELVEIAHKLLPPAKKHKFVLRRNSADGGDRNGQQESNR